MPNLTLLVLAKTLAAHAAGSACLPACLHGTDQKWRYKLRVRHGEIVLIIIDKTSETTMREEGVRELQW